MIEDKIPTNIKKRSSRMPVGFMKVAIEYPGWFIVANDQKTVDDMALLYRELVRNTGLVIAFSPTQEVDIVPR